MPHLASSRRQILGDYVTVLWTAHGSIKGRKMAMRDVTIWQFRHGQIWREWSEFDERSLKEQLGLVPPATPVEKQRGALGASAPIDASPSRTHPADSLWAPGSTTG